MTTFGSMACDSSAVQAGLPEFVCRRLDALPCEPHLLAEQILSPGEREYWRSMRGVEKRRHEWLLGRCAAKQAVRALVDLPLAEIEIVPDPYGRPQVREPAESRLRAGLPALPALSIAHSQGTAVALAVLDSEARVGIDLESLAHRREDFEAIAFSADERSLLAALPENLRQEWALRMWCAKEAVGKALGRGLSAGLRAFHITRVETVSGAVDVELRGGALAQCPQLRGKSLKVYTSRESDFVLSAIIYRHYQNGAVRMRPSRQEILDYLLQKMGELTADWDYPDPVGPESKLFTELGFESLDAVVLCTAIQEHYQTPMPFAELLAEIGQQQRDLSIDELTDFVDAHLGGPAETGSATRRVQ